MMDDELERLREIEAAARDYFEIRDGAWISAHPAGARSVQKAEEHLRELLGSREP